MLHIGLGASDLSWLVCKVIAPRVFSNTRTPSPSYDSYSINTLWSPSRKMLNTCSPSGFSSDIWESFVLLHLILISNRQFPCCFSPTVQAWWVYSALLGPFLRKPFYNSWTSQMRTSTDDQKGHPLPVLPCTTCTVLSETCHLSRTATGLPACKALCALALKSVGLCTCLKLNTP